jgi:hypothetical protein
LPAIECFLFAFSAFFALEGFFLLEGAPKAMQRKERRERKEGKAGEAIGWMLRIYCPKGWARKVTQASDGA